MRRAFVLPAVLVVLVHAAGLRGPAAPPALAEDAPAEVAQAEPTAEPPPPPPPDADGDGAPDGADNCEGVSNPDQADSDGNGVGDACDAPPPPPPPPDADGDGAPDGADNCEGVFNPDQADADGDGLGDTCDAPPPLPTEVPTPVPTAVPTEPPPEAPTEPPLTPSAPAASAAPSPSATPTGAPAPTPPPVPTPVTLGPDDPSLFGWPAGIGGTPLTYWAQAAGYAEPAVVARINAGGPEVTTADGSVWAADAHYEGGQTVERRRGIEVAGTEDDALYRDERRSRIDGGRVLYAIPVPAAGTYTVRVYVAARTFEDGTGGFRTGEQVLAVNLEGGAWELEGWDLSGAGEPLAAAVRSFDVEVADGTLDLEVNAEAGRAAVAALEVISPGRPVGDALVAFALQYVGYPYVWATSGPGSFDCSGFTDFVVANVIGVHIGLNQLEQIAYGTAVAYGDLRPGDLVFFFGTHPFLEGVSHVGIYVGGGQFVHASAQAGAVVVSDLTWGYYGARYHAAVRLA